MTKPQFITFTGADDKTNIDDMVKLATLYDVEFGILFSPSKVGTSRYPSMEWVEKLTNFKRAYPEPGFDLAAHVCGKYAESIIQDGVLDIDLTAFDSVQINTAYSKTDLVDRVWDWKYKSGYAGNIILQSRNELSFPAENRVFWLFDASGGKGIVPGHWPVPRSEHELIGYAGGLSPANVAETLAREEVVLEGIAYWIDMETGVRNENDEFDLNFCRQVCEAVYG